MSPGRFLGGAICLFYIKIHFPKFAAVRIDGSESALFFAVSVCWDCFPAQLLAHRSQLFDQSFDQFVRFLLPIPFFWSPRQPWAQLPVWHFWPLPFAPFPFPRRRQVSFFATVFRVASFLVFLPAEVVVISRMVVFFDGSCSSVSIPISLVS